ncbi:MAG: DJ-1/PfpI family protein [Candidatus Babeliales bacterium]
MEHKEYLKGKKVVFIIASNGYQPIEYGVPKKILESYGIKVITASDKPGGAVASDQSTTLVDSTLDKLKPTDYDGVFFIGGPGAMDCLDNSISYKIASEAKKHAIPYGAICIAPRILAKANALAGKKATGWDDDLALETIFKGNGVEYAKGHDICTDGLVVTAVGPKAAELFAQGIMRVLTKKALGDS